jgi:hypothetical protein
VEMSLAHLSFFFFGNLKVTAARWECVLFSICIEFSFVG